MYIYWCRVVYLCGYGGDVGRNGGDGKWGWRVVVVDIGVIIESLKCEILGVGYCVWLKGIKVR